MALERFPQILVRIRGLKRERVTNEMNFVYVLKSARREIGFFWQLPVSCKSRKWIFVPLLALKSPFGIVRVIFCPLRLFSGRGLRIKIISTIFKYFFKSNYFFKYFIAIDYYL